MIILRDGDPIMALMPVETAILIRRDAAIVRGALERAGVRSSGPAHEPLPAPSAAANTEALTSIFRYEKRNGRLRRVAAPEAKLER